MDFIDSVLLFLQMRWALCLCTALIVFLCFAIFYKRFNRWLRLQFDDICVSFPFIGILDRRWVNTEDKNKRSSGFLGVEEDLCAVYKKYVPLLDKETFAERVEYIKLAGDSGRRTTPGYMWLILGILVTAEALGFSYMLGKWMAMEASENTHVLLMFAIVTVICLVMLLLTHFAGEQAYRTQLLRSLNKDRSDDGAHSKFTPVALNDPQNIDALDENNKKNPDYQRTMNRVARRTKDRGSYGGLWVTALAIIVISVASTWMRYNAMEQDLTRETMLQKEESGTSADPFAMVLPDEITESQSAADNKALLEIQSATRQEGMAAFVMLAFIFIITQIVGIITGYNYSLAGKQSKKAYESILEFDAYEDYLNSLAHVRSLANRRLKTLQTKLIDNSNKSLRELKFDQTFDDYLDIERRKVIAAARGVSQEKQTAAPAAQESAPQITENSAPTIESVKAEMERLNDRDKEAEFLNSIKAHLPDLLAANNGELNEWLAKRREDRKRAAAAQIDVNNLV